MFKKNILYSFFTTILSYLSIKTGNQLEQPSIFYNFLNNASHAAWTSFFFVTRIIGAAIMGNITYCIQACTLLAIVIIIESYILHRSTKTIFLKTLPRVAIINVVHTVIALIIILLNIFKLLICYKHLGIFILLAIRILTSYFIYSKMDSDSSKTIIKKAVLLANIASFAFTTIIIMIIRS